MNNPTESSKAIKRVFIFEPCLGSMTGHWENNCRRFEEALTQMGIEVIFFCQKESIETITNGLKTIGVFDHFIFNPMGTIDDFHNESNLIKKNLESIDDKIFNNHDLLLFPTVVPQLLKSSIEWANSFIHRSGSKVAFVFMFAPADIEEYDMNSRRYRLAELLYFIKPLRKYLFNELYKWRESSDTNFYKECSRLLQDDKDSKLYLFGGSEEFSFNFQSLLNRTVNPLPMMNVITKCRKQQPLLRTTSKIQIGNFGHASLEKGAQFLEYIVTNILKNNSNVEFSLHINPNIHTTEILRYFDKPIERVHCKHGHISYDEYIKILHDTDINLLAYSPVKYSILASAVFVEAVCSENVVVIPEHTWMSREAKRIKTGYVTFKEYNQESITEALQYAISNYSVLKAKTTMARKRFLKTHNVKDFIGKILAATT